MVFDWGLAKRVYSIVPSGRRAAACGVRRGLNNRMHCILSRESRGVVGVRQWFN